MTDESVLKYASLLLLQLKNVVQTHMLMPTVKHVLIFLIRAKTTIYRAYQCSLSYTKLKKIYGDNTNNELYHDRQGHYQNTKVGYHAITKIDCRSQVYYLLEFSVDLTELSKLSKLLHSEQI